MTRRFINVNVALASFTDGDTVGDESLDDYGNLYLWGGAVLGWVQTGTFGARNVNPIAGPGTNPHIIAYSNVSGVNVTAHIPPGKRITHLSVLCTPSVACIAAIVAGSNIANLQNLKGLLVVDAENDAFALGATGSGAAIPSSLVDGQQFYEIPLNRREHIPMAPGTALSKGTNSTGRLDFRCNSLIADMALDYHIICS